MTWLLCDYGEVLSMPQPEDDRAALARAARISPQRFWRGYWEHRPAYDRADLQPADYWAAILRTVPERDMLAELRRLDVASWSHPNPASLRGAKRAAVRGYRLAILSNAPLDLAEVLDRAPWLSPFRPRLFSCRLRTTKPDVEIYRKALQALNAKPDEVVFFDDRAVNVQAALEVGMLAEVFTDPAQFDGLPEMGVFDPVHGQ